MGQYARTTTTAISRTRDEIEHTLMRYGADRFGYMSDGERSVIAFQHRGRAMRITVPIPSKNDREIAYTETGRVRTAVGRQEFWEQAVRQRWRALLLVVKAKLEAVDAGIATFEDEFMPYTLLPNGQTISEWIEPRVAEIYRNGYVPPILELPAPRIREEVIDDDMG